MEKYCISIDWLQVYCLNNLQPVPDTLYAVGMEFCVKMMYNYLIFKP